MDAGLLAKCSCSHCGTHLEFPLEGAGTIINCPHCGKPTELTLSAPPSPAPEGLSVGELMTAFVGPVARTRTSIFYQAGLTLVTLMMLILPLIYLTMIAAAAWGVYLWGTHFTFLLSSSIGGFRLLLVKVMLYLGPLFIGVVLVLFMIKPLFARRAPRAQPLAMNLLESEQTAAGQFPALLAPSARLTPAGRD